MITHIKLISKFSGAAQFCLITGICYKNYEQDCSRKKFIGTFEKKKKVSFEEFVILLWKYLDIFFFTGNLGFRWVASECSILSPRGKVSKYGVISGPYFRIFGLNTEIYSVNLRNQSKLRKIRTRSNLDTFHAVYSMNNDTKRSLYLSALITTYHNEASPF